MLRVFFYDWMRDVIYIEQFRSVPWSIMQAAHDKSSLIRLQVVWRRGRRKFLAGSCTLEPNTFSKCLYGADNWPGARIYETTKMTWTLTSFRLILKLFSIPFKQFALIVPSTLYGAGRRPFWFSPWDLAKQESKMVFLWYGHMGYVWIYPTKEQL
jgi:hypothetical protein